MKAIRHSRRDEYRRETNDKAAELVGSGQWVYVSKFEARQAREQPRPPRRRPWLIGAALAFVTLAALLWAGTAKAADKPVPFKICLTQQQAAQVYHGKKLKYRLVKDDHGRSEACWYAGATLPKHAFILNAGRFAGPSMLAAPKQGPNLASRHGDPAPVPRSTSVAVKPTRTLTQESARVQAVPAGAVPATRVLSFQAMEDDAVLALTGKPESWFTFDAMWSRAMKDAAGLR